MYVHLSDFWECLPRSGCAADSSPSSVTVSRRNSQMSAPCEMHYIKRPYSWLLRNSTRVFAHTIRSPRVCEAGRWQILKKSAFQSFHTVNNFVRISICAAERLSRAAGRGCQVCCRVLQYRLITSASSCRINGRPLALQHVASSCSFLQCVQYLLMVSASSSFWRRTPCTAAPDVRAWRCRSEFSKVSSLLNYYRQSDHTSDVWELLNSQLATQSTVDHEYIELNFEKFSQVSSLLSVL